MDIQLTKLELIKAILETESEKKLQYLRDIILKEQPVKNYQPPQKEIPEHLKIAMESMPDFIPVEELARQQGYHGKKLAEALNNVNEELWKDEDIFELLEMLREK